MGENGDGGGPEKAPASRCRQCESLRGEKENGRNELGERRDGRKEWVDMCCWEGKKKMEGRSWGDGRRVCSLGGEKKEEKNIGSRPKKNPAMWVSFGREKGWRVGRRKIEGSPRGKGKWGENEKRIKINKK